MEKTAVIKIWGEAVGAVAWDAERNLASFEYEPKFLRNNWDLAPFKMPIKSPRIHSFPELRDSQTFKGLPGLLADVLPDKYGNQLINAWLAQQGRPENSFNPIELLLFIGERGMGALEFEKPILKPRKNTFVVEMDDLVSISRKMLNQRESFATNMQKDEEKAMLDILRIGTSAGGARPKAIIAYNDKTGEIRSGQTKAPKGFEHWLIKLDGVSDEQFVASKGYGRVEMAYHLMAKDCEIEMTDCRLQEENGRAHFMTRRFDREGGDQKHHVQTWCAMQHYDYNEIYSFSYEQLFQTTRMLKLTYLEMEQLFRRMVFNVLARNCDDHTKNFAFILKQDSKWKLSPAYDVCHAYQPGHKWVSQQVLSVNGKRDGITNHDMLEVAKSMKIKKASTIITQISDIVKNWKKYAEDVKVEGKLRDEIAKTLIV